MNMNKVESVKISVPIMKGLLYAFACMLACTVIVSLLLTWTGMKEESMSVYAFFIHGMSIFIGSFVCGRMIGAKGWYAGGMTGIIYSLIVILVAFLGFDVSMGLSLLLLVVLSFVMGALGGIIGVNTKK